MWKQKVFPVLCKLEDFKPQNTFPIYMVVSWAIGAYPHPPLQRARGQRGWLVGRIRLSAAPGPVPLFM